MKRAIVKTTILLITSLFATTSFAITEHLEVINEHCVTVVDELNQVVNSNQHDRCTPRVLRAASFIQIAGQNIRENQIPEAWMNLNSALYVLIDLSKYKADCTYFGPKSYHYLFEVNHIKEEIESLGN